MGYTIFELLWLFLIYSFCGWLAETALAAVKQKKFVNRGMVNLPFSVLTGFVAVFITIFGRELSDGWLYIGSVVAITVFITLTGRLIEKLYHEKWWDYSKSRWRIGEYASIPVVALLGILAVVMMKWGNSLVLNLFHLMPTLIGKIIVWVFSSLLVLDVVATWLVVYGKTHRAQSWEKVDQKFDGVTKRLSNAIYTNIEKRVHKAYPDSKQEEVEKDRSVFADGCGFYKLVWLFIIGAFAGDIVETIFCRITAGVWMSRSSVVWGPFSIVWGLALALATFLLHKYKDKSDRFLFFTGVFLGGVYEYVCSVFTEIVFGKVFWDYSHIPFNLGGRINLLYCFFWGIAAVAWMKYAYPKISALIEISHVKIGKIVSWIMIIFMCCNMAVSGLALIRSTQRANDVPATSAWQKIMDERFDDERLEKIYPNAMNTD